ncbi:PREDICTED: protein indeterminate-domain 14-like [Tarenaya hassleriana]|uniref:protein indeterminate-domain 14-like n=1 Tax=Tarenaya hassleriana TaxID=28532 RepID=UPI00053C9232|nr:PREDICTED: protein indeterminate-domain 14-like [Tarenaya hassleriana]
MIDYDTINSNSSSRSNPHNNHRNGPSSSSDHLLDNNGSASSASQKRKRRPAGTPDPDAEVMSLSPRTLLESDRYVCEICSQGFQRDQNLQMHRRRHKVPWKLLKRENNQELRKRVYVCPEPTCLHHDPCHALGDLVGIKKHFRRKHSSHKQWVCERCSKGYAVQSDYKAHLKTCGTRGHSCDCGRVFSRVERFIEHQDNCTMRRAQPLAAAAMAATSSRTASTASTPSSDTANLCVGPLLPGLPLLGPPPTSDQQRSTLLYPLDPRPRNDNPELHLLPSRNADETHETSLELSIGVTTQMARTSFDMQRKNGYEKGETSSRAEVSLMERGSEQLMIAEEARREAKRQIEMAEMEFANAKRIRQQAQAELEKAQILRDEATKRISATMMQITCHSCKQQFQAPVAATSAVAPPSFAADESTSLAVSYVSSGTTEGEGE